MSGFAFSVSATWFRIEYDFGSIWADPVLNWTFSMIWILPSL
jgi:hypothetical protein